MKKSTFVFLLSLLFTYQAAAQCLSGDCKTGNGIQIYSSGERYIGQFKNGKSHGLGTYFYQDGSRYFGYWAYGNPDGAGIQRLPNGKEEKGIWRRGVLVQEDPQLVISDNGQVQLLKFGCINGNCQNGNGIVLYPDGSLYSGDFKNSKKEGVGICFYPGQTVYRGNWKNGLPDGRGTMELANGEKKAGFWEKGQLQIAATDRDKIRTPDPSLLEDQCISGDCENGYGIYQSADGRKFKGPFKNGKPHGTGVYYFPNGERYEGNMVAGELDGRGALFFPDGRAIRGYWEKGKYVQSLEPTAVNPNSPKPESLQPKVKIWAVIVGIASYDHMPVLRFTDDDAYRIYAFLKSPEGGALPDEQIELLIDESATRQNIVEAMTQTFRQAGADDLILFYFSGHGLPGAFLPIDYDGLNQKLFHQQVSNILKNSSAKFKICIADACHSGGLFAMRSPDARTTLSSYYDQLAEAKSSTALIMSSKSDETSLEASGLRHGVFSHFLIRALKGEADQNQNKIVSIQELFNFVYKNVRAYTGNLQSPVLRGSYDPDMPVSVVREKD